MRKGFACPADRPHEKALRFADLAIGEEFSWKGDPYGDVFRKTGPESYRSEYASWSAYPSDLVVKAAE